MFNWGPTEREIWYSCVDEWKRTRAEREKKKGGGGWVACIILFYIAMCSFVYLYARSAIIDTPNSEKSTLNKSQF